MFKSPWNSLYWGSTLPNPPLPPKVCYVINVLYLYLSHVHSQDSSNDFSTKFSSIYSMTTLVVFQNFMCSSVHGRSTSRVKILLSQVCLCSSRKSQQRKNWHLCSWWDNITSSSVSGLFVSRYSKTWSRSTNMC